MISFDEVGYFHVWLVQFSELRVEFGYVISLYLMNSFTHQFALFFFFNQINDVLQPTPPSYLFLQHEYILRVQKSLNRLHQKVVIIQQLQVPIFVSIFQHEFLMGKEEPKFQMEAIGMVVGNEADVFGLAFEDEFELNDGGIYLLTSEDALLFQSVLHVLEDGVDGLMVGGLKESEVYLESVLVFPKILYELNHDELQF